MFAIQSVYYFHIHMHSTIERIVLVFCHAKIGPAQKWPPRPILTVKNGPSRPLLVAKIGPPLPILVLAGPNLATKLVRSYLFVYMEKCGELFCLYSM